MNIDNTVKDLEEIALRVNDFILSHLNGNPRELYAASSSYIISGGKRLRPYLVIKSCEMFGGSEDKAIPAAAAVELVHNFSLIHDDIIDNDDIRHGIPTVHRKYGLPLALISGDILFSKAFEVLSEGSKLGLEDKIIKKMVSKLSSSCVYVCEGQAMDTAMAAYENIPTTEEYLEMIGKKTAALFEVSCAMGTLSSSNSSDIDINNLAIFGRHIGVAFQLVDDLIGVVGNTRITGKAVGNDIREGKKTYPILLALRNANNNEKSKIIRALGNKTGSRDELDAAVNVISSLNIEGEVRELAYYEMEQGIGLLEKYVENHAKRALISSAKFIVQRSL